MNPGIDFSIDGPMIDGTWQNMQTGDIFEVRESFFQDGQLLIQTTDGRMFDYNTIQNYVKVDKPVSIPKQPKPKQLPKNIIEEIEPTNTSNEADVEMLTDDIELLNGLSNIVSKSTPTVVKQPAITPTTVEDEDMKLVNRVLSRTTAEPHFNYKLEWKNFPIKQMEMLVNFMGVPEDKICDYYINKINTEEIKAQLQEMLTDYISQELNKLNLNDSNETNKKEPLETPTKPKKNPKSK